MIRPFLFAAALAFTAMAGAADAPPPHPKTRFQPAPPPPGMNDPGVSTGAKPAAPPEARPADTGRPPDALAPLPKPDTRPVRDRASRAPTGADTSQRAAASDVTIRKQGGDTVEEYRQAGHVWMIRIVPAHGPVQTFMDTTGNGRLTRDPREGPISPVYYTLYEWN
ncbi:MAG TPA: DUF2782 domain-containing protein [Rhodanobacteraceae bacterium]|nr:DUF2782 domain-containing protein [Rhodanobacteraceae bacterium]